MPFLNLETARLWRLNHKRKLRADRVEPEPKRETHRSLGIKTFVHRQAVLPDYRERTKFDRISWSRSNSHLYRESITLASV